MNSIVIYASHAGNTKKIAAAMAAALAARGSVQLLSVEEAPSQLPQQTDLAIVGSPTEAHRMIAPATQFFARLDAGALKGLTVAAFDTRLRGPRWLWGSAALGIAQALRLAGAQVIAPAESFYVDMKPHLQPGEEARAAAWAAMLADTVAASTSVSTARAA